MKNLKLILVCGFLIMSILPAKPQSGRTLDLDGIDDYMVIPSHDDLNILADEDYTITFFAKINTLSGTPRLVYKRDMNSWNGPAYDFYINGSSGYALNLRESTGANLGGQPVSDNSLTAGRWYHFAIVVDRTAGAYKIYLNGLLKTTQTNNLLKTNPVSNDFNVIVGAYFDSREANPYANFLNGSIDNLRFWNKALTVKEITDDFTADVVEGQANLMAAYDFQNIENGVVHDISGRGHDATLYGKTTGGEPTSVTYCTPTYSTGNDNTSSLSNRYVAQATTSGATGNISYSASSYSMERYVNYTADTIRTARNETFTLNMLSPNNGATNLTDGMQYTQTDLYADWNGDGVFDNTELVKHTGNINASSTGQCNLTFNITVPADAVGGVTRLRARYYDAWTTNNPAPTSCSAANKGFSIDFAMYVDAPISTPSITASELLQETLWVGQGNRDQSIIRAAITVTGSGNMLDLTSVSINMDGTTDINDVSKVKVYIADDNAKIFDVQRATLFGEADPASGTITVNGNGKLSVGINYLWITYDLYATAVEGNVVDASVLSLEIANGASTYVLPTTTATGNRTILLEHAHLFKQKTAGSLYYRIPAIITAADGSLVAAADKRWDALSDLGAHLDVVVTRSTDKGKTWSAPITIAGANTTVGYGDPALVVDNVVNPGTIICVFASGSAFWGSTQASPISVNVSKSIDNGLTWSDPVDITNQVWGTGSNIPGIYGAFAASGRALQLKDGRIMFVIAARNTSSWGGTTLNYAVYSDDGGTTWTTSPNSPTPNSTTSITTANADEAKVVELADGTVLMSIRNRNNEGKRLYATSTDRGLNWTTRANWGNFTATNCNGDVLYYTYKSDGYAKNRMLHSIPDNASVRKNVSVKLTYDEGNTWDYTKSICEDMSAYSSLTILPDNTIGIFYEKGKWDSSVAGDDGFELYFARFSLNWLTDGMDNELDQLHTVSWSKIGDGSVSVVSDPNASAVRNGGSLRKGTNLVLNIKPEEGNGIASVLVNNVDVTTSVVDNSYNFSMDNNTEIKVNFVDLTTGCQLVNKIEDIKVYPNPVGDYLIIEGCQDGSDINIVDLTGRTLLAETAKTNSTLNLSKLESGIYLLKAKKQNGESFNSRIMKK